MKKIKILLLFIGLGMFITSCEKDSFNMDMTKDPNYLREDQANIETLMNKVQVDFARFVESMGHTTGELVRIFHMSGRSYESVYSPNYMDTQWERAYANMFTDMDVIKNIASEGNTHHIAMIEIMKAYTLMTLVDVFGDVPYSESNMGAENTNPHLDSGESVYQAAIGLLDDAITKLEDPNYNTSFDPENDLYYNKDWDKWLKLANTLKMKAYLTTRLVDPDAMTKFNAIVTDGNYIADISDDFQFQWYIRDADPDVRHPRYTYNYTSTGGNEYMSNSLMDYMSGRNDDAYLNPDHFDPRILFYFYRQNSTTPGKGGAAPDGEVLDCSLHNPPAHYTGFTFCGVAKGWWGRDHGNDTGIPPDNFLRTLAGVYPVGGALDDLSYTPQQNGDGSGGDGITPIMLSSWVKFMIAESKMVDGAYDDAKPILEDAIQTSWGKVYNFKPVTDRFAIIFDQYLPQITDYWDYFLSQVMDDWDNATDDEKWEIFAKQYFVATYGNGIDAYNFYRRTGFPKNIGSGIHLMQPNLEANPGGFIRSFWYPSSLVNRNSNVSQKSGVTQQVFWDTNPSSPGFPVAN